MNEFPHATDCARRTILKGAVAGGLAGLAFASFPFPAFADADAKEWPGGRLQAEERGRRAEGALRQIGRGLRQDQPRCAGDRRERRGGADCGRQHAAECHRIAILVPENPFTLAAAYKIPAGTDAMVASRLKMAKTSKVIAVVESGGKLYSATKEVKVTVGGCGG